MVIFPAIVAALTPVAEAALVSALVGGAFGGATCAVGSALTGYHQHGKLNHEIALSSAYAAADCAAEGALVGGAFGGAFAVVAPAVAPTLQVVDDLARPVLHAVDDTARPALQALDDLAKPLVKRIGAATDDAVAGAKKAAESLGNIARSPFNLLRNSLNARNYLAMGNAPAGKMYVYVMKDAATGLHKIGLTTKAPRRRLDGIAKAIKSKLDYTCIIETAKPPNGTKSLERKLHDLFEEARQTHPTPHSGATEWFVLTAAQVARACSH